MNFHAMQYLQHAPSQYNSNLPLLRFILLAQYKKNRAATS